MDEVKKPRRQALEGGVQEMVKKSWKKEDAGNGKKKARRRRDAGNSKKIEERGVQEAIKKLEEGGVQEIIKKARRRRRGGGDGKRS